MNKNDDKRPILILPGFHSGPFQVGVPAYECLSSSQYKALERYDKWQLERYMDIYFFNPELGLIHHNQIITSRYAGKNTVDKKSFGIFKRRMNSLSLTKKIFVMLDSPLRAYFMLLQHVSPLRNNSVKIGEGNIGLQRKEIRSIAQKLIA
jgi:hypothetical protein